MATRTQFTHPSRRTLILCILSLALSACSSSTKKINFDSSKSVHDAIEAATGPLQDLNLRQPEIPPLLTTISADPYAMPATFKCATIREELAELDTLLGPDFKPKGVEYAASEKILSDIKNAKMPDIEMPDAGTIANSGIEFAQNRLFDVIRGHTNIIPFRSIVRRVTGADSYQRKIEDAYQAGKLRRAYLKGIAHSRFGPRCLSQPITPSVSAKITQ